MKFTSILFSFLFMYSTHLMGQSLSKAVMDEFENHEIVDCIIVMSDQLDMYGKTEGMTKNEKANLVYHRLNAHASRSQVEISLFLESEKIAHQRFIVFNGFQAWLTKEQANSIVQLFQVDKIVYNTPARVSEIDKISPSNLDRSVVEWGILQVKADSVWQLGFKGEGVVIAGQDTGYDFDNSLILSKYRGYNTESIDHNYNWHDAIDTLNPLNNDTINDPSVNPCGLLSLEPCDDHGHGTHTMGTMVGNDEENDIGMAPAASWIGCRNMDRGWGKPSTYTECFEWFLAPTDLEGMNPNPNLAPHVINNSWSCPPQEGCNPENWAFMETVVNNLSAAGTVVVVSAGNDGNAGCGSIRNPASIFENSFSIGATNTEDNKAGFSSIGPVQVDSSGRLKPDVVAPGVGVRSIYLNEEFRTWNGTSMAGPHVAGAVALIINANPSLAGEVDIIKEILRSTAVPLIDSTQCDSIMALEVPNFYFGHGRIDVLEAVKKALTLTDVNEIESIESTVKVYPNPNRGSFNIVYNSTNRIENISISDLSGRKVTYNSSLISANEISIDGLAPGIYICSFIENGRLYAKKIVVGQ